MIKQHPKFLTKKDCNEIIKLIDANHTRSSVAGAGNQQSIIEDSRTSSTSTLDVTNPTIKRIHQKISKHLGLDIKRGESLQGQLYEPGQYFKPHTDFF